jgi:hypothetical protein
METFARKMQALASERREQIDAENQNKIDPYVEIQQRIHLNSVKHVQFIMRQVEIQAQQGFGSCFIMIDTTTDMFFCMEHSTSYSAIAVRKLCEAEGLRLGRELEDYYDAYKCKITWHKGLPESQYSIPMSES